MALNLNSSYPTKTNAPDADYPYGSARNQVTPGDGTGTPLDEDLVNDIVGFQQALLDMAGISPTGSPDKVGASQYLEAITSMHVRKFPTLAAAIVDTNLQVGDAINLAERTTGNGGGAIWDVVLASGVTPNTYNIVQCTGVGTLAIVLRNSGAVNIQEWGTIVLNDSTDSVRAANNAVFISAINNNNVIYIDVTNDALHVAGNIPILNGRRLIFASEYMGEPLFADPDKGIIGSGSAPVFITDAYPGGSNTHRQIRLDNARIRNTNHPCLVLQDSDDAKLYDCHMNTTESEAVKARFSARIAIRGGQYASSFSVSDPDNFAMTFYNNCNGLYISPDTIITGGTNGGAIDVSLCQKVDVGGIIESCGQHGVRIAGYKGDNLDSWTTATVYTKGDYVQNSSNSYVANVDHTSGATFAGDAASWDINNGNCNGVNVSAYIEATNKPLSFGAKDLCLGLNADGAYVGSTNASAPQYVIESGRIVGGTIKGNSWHKKGTEPTLSILKPSTGSSVADYMLGVDYDNNYQQGGGANFTLDGALGVADKATLFAKNQFSFDNGIKSGTRKEWISPILTANVSVSASLVLEAANGGRIESIQIIDKIGTITCTLFIGSSAAASELLSVDPETLLYTLGKADATIGASGLIRPSDDVRYSLAAGVGTGTFRLKLIYRN
jgi:hypothetical protein